MVHLTIILLPDRRAYNSLGNVETMIILGAMILWDKKRAGNSSSPFGCLSGPLYSSFCDLIVTQNPCGVTSPPSSVKIL